MRIRFVTLYFPPEVGAAQRRISELAKRLSAFGHDVTILTGFPNYPSGIKPEKYRGKFIMKENVDGYNIIRVPHYVAPNKGFLKRIFIHLTFAFSASIYSVLMNRDDIAYVESPPLFNGFIGLALKWFRRVPYIFNVADLWPQTAIELGALKNKQLIAFTQFLERFFYDKANKILAITAGVKSSLLYTGCQKDKVSLLTNGVDPETFKPTVKADAEICSYRPKNGLLVLYAGTHGLIYSLDTIIEAAKLVKDENIYFLFVGDGADKERIIDVAREKQLENISFLPARPQGDMPSVFRAADIAIISLRDLPVSKKILPMKSFELMAVGTPIILAARGEMAGYMKDANNGYIIEPENSKAMAKTILEFKSIDNDVRKKFGQNSREYVIKNFSHEKIAKRLEQLMREEIGND